MMDGTAKKQSILINNLEGMGDILEYQARRKRNKPVLQGLKRIKDIHDRLFSIKNREPERFERLLLSQKYFDLYQKNREAAAFEVAYRPKENLLAFYTTINQFMRVYEAALSVNNDEVSAQSIYYLIHILTDLASKPDNAPFIKQILDELYSLNDSGGDTRKKAYVASAVAFDWYTASVAGHKDTFRPEYLSAFNQALLFSILRIVQDNDSKTFDHLLGSLVNSGFGYYNVTTWELDDVLMENNFQAYRQLDSDSGVRAKTNELENKIGKIRTYDQLVTWEKELGELAAQFKPFVTNADDKKKFNKSIRELKKRAAGFYKQNALMELFFDIAARCLFYRKYSFIYDLWEYNQPTDASATWGNHNLYHTQPDQLVRYYFENLNARDFGISWPGHHGNEHYYKRYFILLLARDLTRNPAVDVSVSNIDDVSVLQSITFSIPDLLGVTQSLQEDGELLSELQLSSDTLEQQVVPKLNSILESANSRLEQIELTKELTPSKVSEFKDDLNKGYEGAEVFAAIFKEHGLYSEAPDTTVEPTVRRLQGLSRSAFISGWNVYYGSVATELGQQLAIAKNEQLLEKILERATEDSIDNLGESLLANLSKPVFLIYGMQALMYFRQNTEPLTREELEQQPDDVRSIGWYSYNDERILVLQVPRNDRVDSACVIVDMGSRATIGTYKQNKEFSVSFDDLAQNPEMVETILQERGEADSDSKRKELARTVLIEVSEAYTLTLARSPKVIKINLNRTINS